MNRLRRWWPLVPAVLFAYTPFAIDNVFSVSPDRWYVWVFPVAAVSCLGLALWPDNESARLTATGVSVFVCGARAWSVAWANEPPLHSAVWVTIAFLIVCAATFTALTFKLDERARLAEYRRR